MKRWMILLDRLAGFVVVASRRRNREAEVSCLRSMVARSGEAIRGRSARLGDWFGPAPVGSSKRPTRVEVLEPRLLFSASPIADWSFDDDDPAGTAVIDVSGNGHTGTLVGDAALVADGVLGQGVSLDGSGDRIDVADSSLINLSTTTERSISLFFKADDVSVSSRKQVLYEEGGVSRGLNIYLHDSTLYVGGWNDADTGEDWLPTHLSTGSVVSGQWHHVVLTLDGDTTVAPDAMKGYLDGVAFGSADGSRLLTHSGDIGIGDMDTATVFHDGTLSGTGGHGFAGTLDNVQVYNKVLTPTEVQGLSAILSQEAYFKFDQSSGIVITDATGNGATADVEGGATWQPTTGGVLLGGLQLDGADDAVRIADLLPGTSSPPPFTFSVWFNPDELPTDDKMVIVAGDISVFSEAASISIGSSSEHGSVLVAGRPEFLGLFGEYEGTTPVVAGQWNHLAMSYDGTTTRIYLNGNLEIEGQIDLGDAFTHGLIGRLGSSTSGVENFKGSIDEVRLFSAGLSTEQVQGIWSEVIGTPAPSINLTVPGLGEAEEDLSLIGRWNFEEASGFVAEDSSGNQIDATLTNTTWIDDAERGSVLGFDGSTSYASTGYVLDPAATAFTASAWVKVDALPSTENAVLIKPQAGSGRSWLYISSGSGEIMSYLGTSSTSTGIVPTVGQWHHVALTVDEAQTISIYVDGVLAVSSPAANPIQSVTSEGLNFGARNNGNDLLFEGAMDGVRVYERDLSAAEVQALVEAESGGSVNSVAPTGASVGVLGERFGDDRDNLPQSEQDDLYGGFYAAYDTRLASASLNVQGGSGDWHLEFDDTELAVWQQVASGEYVRVTSGVAMSTVALTETIDLKIEGVSKSSAFGDSILKAVLTAEDGSTYEDRIDLTVFDADLAIDSDNNAGLGLPDSDFAEHQAEADGDSKVVLINDTGSVELAGNAWKQTAFTYSSGITADTVLAFDYKSDAGGEQHLIAALSAGSVAAGYQLHGSENQAGTGWFSSHQDYSVGEGWRRYEIAIGQDYTGPITDLLLVADDDANATGASLYRDIVMYEATDPAGTVVRLDLAQAAFASAAGVYAGQDDANSTATYTAPAGFTPTVLKVDLPDDADPATALIDINYSAWAPNGSADTTGGHVRLWLKAADDATRSFDSVKDGGDYLAPGSYTAAELGLTGGTTELTVWVQAIDRTDALLVNLSLIEGNTTDQSGNGYHVSTTTGDPTATNGPDGLAGTAMHFDGNDALVIDSLPDTTDSLSVGMWAQSDTATWSHYGVLASRPGSFVMHPDLNTNDIAFKIWIDGTKHEVNYKPDATFDITDWHHYLGTYDAASGELNLWVDGQVVANKNTGGGAIDQTDGVMYLGQHNGFNRYLEGALSGVRVYDHALGTIEVSELLAIRASQGLIGLWNLGSDQASDATGGPNANFYASDTTTGPDGLADSATTFNGTNEYVQILGSGNNPNGVPPLTNGFTAGIWAKSDTATWNESGTLIERRPTFILHPNSGGTSLSLFVGVAGSGWQSITVDLATEIPGFDLTQWHHYAASHDAATGQSKIYVDGIEVASGTVAAGNLNSDPWAIFVGRDTFNSSRYFDGALAQVTFYSRPLEPSEVAQVAKLSNNTEAQTKHPATLNITVSPYGNNGVTSNGEVQIDATLASMRPIQNLTADVLSPSEVVLTWQPDHTAVNGYVVLVSSDNGQTYTPWQTVEQGSGSALVEGLSEHTSYVFSLSIINEESEGSSSSDPVDGSEVDSASTAPATTPERAAGADAQTTFLVRLNSPLLQRDAETAYHGGGFAFTKGESTVIIDGQQYENVTAESAEAAIKKAIQGLSFIVNVDGEFNTYVFNSKAYEVVENGDSYRINLEDSFNWTNIDLDYDDWYWDVNVKTLDLELEIEDHYNTSVSSTGSSDGVTGDVTVSADADGKSKIYLTTDDLGDSVDEISWRIITFLGDEVVSGVLGDGESITIDLDGEDPALGSDWIAQAWVNTGDSGSQSEPGSGAIIAEVEIGQLKFSGISLRDEVNGGDSTYVSTTDAQQPTFYLGMDKDDIAVGEFTREEFYSAVEEAPGHMIHWEITGAGDARDDTFGGKSGDYTEEHNGGIRYLEFLDHGVVYTVTSWLDIDDNESRDPNELSVVFNVIVFDYESLTATDRLNPEREVKVDDVNPDAETLYIGTDQTPIGGVKLTAELIPDIAEARAWTYWRIIDSAGDVVPGAEGHFDVDAIFDGLVPGDTYTIESWIDRDGDKQRDDRQTLHTIDVVPVFLDELSVYNAAWAAYEETADSLTPEEIYVAVKPDGTTADIKVESVIDLDAPDARAEVLWQIEGTTVAPVTKGDLTAATFDLNLDTSGGNRTYKLTAGFDGNENDTLNDNEITRTIDIHVIEVDALTVKGPELEGNRTFSVTKANNDRTLYFGAIEQVLSDPPSIGFESYPHDSIVRMGTSLDIGAIFQPATAGDRVGFSIESIDFGQPPVGLSFIDYYFDAANPQNIFLETGSYHIQLGVDVDQDGIFDPVQAYEMLEATIHVVEVDLDIDSDNDNHLDDPDLSDIEDAVESLQGKNVFNNLLDLDGDFVLDYMDFDGISPSNFTPVVLELPERLQGAPYTDIEITFEYQGDDPGQFVGETEQYGPLAPLPVELMRLWTRDGDEVRPTSTYIQPGQAYSYTDFPGLAPGQTVTFFLEALKVEALDTEQLEPDDLLFVDVTPAPGESVIEPSPVPENAVTVDIKIIGSQEVDGVLSADRVYVSTLENPELVYDINDDGTISQEDISDLSYPYSAQNILVNNADRNNNGIRDFAEGYTGGLVTDEALANDHALSHLFLDLHAVFGDGTSATPSYEEEDIWVRFKYDSSDPSQSVAAAGADTMDALDGVLRLWRSTGNGWGEPYGTGTSRDGGSVNASGGDFLVANDWIKLTDLASARTVVRGEQLSYYDLLVEAVNAVESNFLDTQVTFLDVQVGVKTDQDTEVLLSGLGSTAFYNVIEPEAPSYGDPTSAIGVGDGAAGGNPMLQSYLGYSRLDGQVASFSLPGLSGDPFAWGIPQVNTWHVSASEDYLLNTDVVGSTGSLLRETSSTPRLVRAGSSVIAILGENNRLYFDYSTAGYTPRFFGGGELIDLAGIAHTTGNPELDQIIADNPHGYLLTDTAGNQFLFHDIGRWLVSSAGSLPLNTADGELWPSVGSVVDLLNQAEENSEEDHQIHQDWDHDQIGNDGRWLRAGQLLGVTTASGQHISYNYKSDIPGVLESISRDLGSGVTEELVYHYNPASLTFLDGSSSIQPGLESIELKRDGVSLRSMHYDAFGFVELVKGAPTSTNVLERTYSRGATLQNSSGADVKGLIIFDHAAIERSELSKEVIRDLPDQDLLDKGAMFISPTLGIIPGTAESSGLTGAGSGRYELNTVDINTDLIGSNVGRYETTVKFFDASGNELTDRTEVYVLNAAREVISHTVTADVTDDGTNNPEDWVSEYTYDRDGRLLTESMPSGLTTVYEYFDSGDKEGLLKKVSIQDIAGDTPNHTANLTTFDYASYDDVMRLNEVTEVLDGSTETGNTTTYTYTGVNGTASTTTALPAVSTANHGTNVQDKITEHFDMYGRLTQTVYTDVANATSTNDTSVYNPVTRTLTVTVDDAIGGLQLTTVTHFDELGRVQRVDHADGTRTYYHVYETDALMIIMSQSGWKPSDPANQALGPITQQVFNWKQGVNATFRYAPHASQSIGDFTDWSQQFTKLGTWISDSHAYVDLAGRVIEEEINGVEVDILSEISYDYDTYGRLIKTNNKVDATTTITDETVFDALGRVTQLKSAGQLIQSFIYDDNGVGDGNVTTVTLHPGGSEADRKTLNVYDWRNHMVASKQGDEDGSGEADINRPGTVYIYDNLGRITKTEIYDADGSTPSVNGSSVTWSGGATLERTDEIKYDARGQVYETKSTDPDTSYTVTAGLWYDYLGQVIKQKAPGGLTTKTTYDNLGRATDVYLTDDASGDTTHTGDTVLEHAHYDYDNAGNVIFSKTTQRNPSGADRVTAVSRYYDSLDRLKKIVDHGTHGSGLSERPATAPARAADNRVATYNYSDDGLAVMEITHDLVFNYTYYDALGRIVKTERADNETAFVLDTDTAAGGTSTQRIAEQTTSYIYDAVGRVMSQTYQPVGTEVSYVSSYEYFNDGTGGYNLQLPGYDAAASDEANAGLIESSHFNYLGQSIMVEPSNGLIHEYKYDIVGRLIRDETSGRTATVDPAPADESQRVIDGEGRFKTYDYDALGNMVTIKEYEVGASLPRSTVTNTYNAFGQMTNYASSNANVSYDIDYNYANWYGGTRLTSTTYDDGTKLTYWYLGENNLDHTISRISSMTIQRPGDTIWENLESYEYLGLGTPLEITKYSGGSAVLTETRSFDAFGQFGGQEWKDAGGTTQLHFDYGYDDRGRLTSLDDKTSTNHDVSRSFDAAGRLTGGTDEEWKLDENGLNRSVENDNQRLSQQDMKSPRFQGWSLSAIDTDWITDAIDVYRPGLLDPTDAPDSAQAVRFDPWGRVIGRQSWEITYDSNNQSSAGLTQTATYVYDAAGQMVQMDIDRPVGQEDYRVDHIVDASGRVLATESHILSSGLEVSTYERQRYVWSPVTGELVYREREAANNPSLDISLGSTTSQDFVAVDAEGNTVGLFDSSTGAVHSRLWYTPSGEVKTVSGAGGHAAGTSSALDTTLSDTGFVYLFGQGRYLGYGSVDTGTDELHGGVTLLTGGLQYDALENSVVRVSAFALWQDINDNAPEPIEYTWWERHGGAVERGGVTLVASVAGGVIGTFIGGPIGTAVGAYLAGSLVAGLYGVSDRLDAGQSLGQAWGGGFADGSGVGNIYAGHTNYDIATGDYLGLSAGDQNVQLALGYASVLPVAGVVGRGLKHLPLRIPRIGPPTGGAVVPIGPLQPQPAFAISISWQRMTAGALASQIGGPPLAFYATTGAAVNTGRTTAQSYASGSGVRIQTPRSLRAQSQVDAFEYHHIFLKHDGFRRWLRGFVQNADGFDVHQYTVRLARLDHQVLHAPVKGLKGGFWEQAMRQEITRQFGNLGRKLSHDELLNVGRAVAERFNIADDFVPYPH